MSVASRPCSPRACASTAKKASIRSWARGPCIQDTIRRALADELLFGKLVDGGSVTVDLDESGKVTLDFEDSGKPPSSDAPDKQEVELVD